MGINKVSDVGGLISYVSGVSSWDSATAANVVIPLEYTRRGARSRSAVTSLLTANGLCHRHRPLAPYAGTACRP
jgi:hypothetical protein